MTTKQIKEYLAKQSAAFKVGDKVMVTKIAASESNGWYNHWVSGMDGYLGKESYITQMDADGCSLSTVKDGNAIYAFPFFVLKKVPAPVVVVEPKKVMFLKTVREDYTSVWAIGRFKTKYEIGKRFQFPKESPAHGYLPGHDGWGNYPFLNGPDASVSAATLAEHHFMLDAEASYNRRPEPMGCRVLICYGILEFRKVPCYEIASNWDLNITPYAKNRWVSTDFEVVGEITGDFVTKQDRKMHSSYEPNSLAKVIEKTVYPPAEVDHIVPKRSHHKKVVKKAVKRSHHKKAAKKKAKK